MGREFVTVETLFSPGAATAGADATPEVAAELCPTLRIWYWPVAVLTSRLFSPAGMPWPGCRLCSVASGTVIWDPGAPGRTLGLLMRIVLAPAMAAGTAGVPALRWFCCAVGACTLGTAVGVPAWLTMMGCAARPRAAATIAPFAAAAVATVGRFSTTVCGWDMTGVLGPATEETGGGVVGEEWCPPP